MGKLFKSLLFWNQSANLKQTWHGWSLGSILSKLCPVTTTSIQDGHLQQTYCSFNIGPYGKKCFKIVTGHNFESWPPKDHSSHVCFKLTDWFQRRRLLNIFSIGSYVKIKSSHGGHLEFPIFFWNHKTDLNQTWQKCSLDGHIQDFCFWRWSEIQHGCQGP
jgi:hypothetical protein